MGSVRNKKKKIGEVIKKNRGGEDIRNDHDDYYFDEKVVCLCLI